MIAAGHQPNYLPYLGFFAKVAIADVFVIVDNVQFVKRGPFGFQHRARIRTPDGWRWLTVPVLTRHKFTQRIMDVQINNAEPWRRKHWRSIWYNYKDAPYFGAYADHLESIYSRQWDRLCDLNVALIRFLFDSLGIRKPVYIASEVGIGGKASELIIDICRKTGADTYLHGRHGRDYADLELIAKSGIRNIFQYYEHPAYRQQFDGFEPYMSVIDLLFNCGPDSLSILLEGNRIEWC
jgi:hypothetical protein